MTSRSLLKQLCSLCCVCLSVPSLVMLLLPYDLSPPAPSLFSHIHTVECVCESIGKEAIILAIDALSFSSRLSFPSRISCPCAASSAAAFCHSTQLLDLSVAEAALVSRKRKERRESWLLRNSSSSRRTERKGFHNRQVFWMHLSDANVFCRCFSSSSYSCESACCVQGSLLLQSTAVADASTFRFTYSFPPSMPFIRVSCPRILLPSFLLSSAYLPSVFLSLSLCFRFPSLFLSACVYVSTIAV